MSKIIQSGEYFDSWMSNLGRKALKKIDSPLARNNLPGLVRNLTSKAINKFERKISGKVTLFISNEYVNDIIKAIKSLEDSGVLS